MYSVDELQNIINTELQARSNDLKTKTPAGLYNPIDYSLEMGGKLNAETAYKNIKLELKELKRVRKSFRKGKGVQPVQRDETLE